MNPVERLVAEGDVDELLRHVDRLCSAREWDELVELRDRCRRAFERGHQLWPAAAHAEYRLALEAPGPFAGAVIEPGAGRFSLGPLTEVAASTHTWAELAEHVPQGPLRAVAAHERVLRGEDLRGDARIDLGVLELPLTVQAWEPEYPLATYRADKADFGDAPIPRRSVAVDIPSGARTAMHDPETCQALRDLVVWETESEGVVSTAAVEGDVTDALAALGIEEARAAEVVPSEALALMAWAAASGGAHGRRRGMAYGRFGAWWAASALAGLLDDWPPEPDALDEALGELRFWRWDPGASETGWVLRLAVEDPADGVAWAIAATDATDTDTPQATGPSTRSR